MTPKAAKGESEAPRSVLVHCHTFGDALVTLVRKKQTDKNSKFEDILASVPITVRNWRRIIANEVTPGTSTLNDLSRELCGKEDRDVFQALYLKATQDKKRFGASDISGLIKMGSGVDCTARDTIDPKCFRSIVYSSGSAIDGGLVGAGAMEFFRSIRSLLASQRLPARSEFDRKLRIAIVLYRETWLARTMSRFELHERLVQEIEALGIEESSAFIRGSFIDLRLLSTNAPDEIVFPEIDKPVIDSHVDGFKKVVELFRVFDQTAGDPLKEYGFASAEDDARINMLRLVCIYGADEASAALTELNHIKESDEARGAPRFITIYNDLIEAEALISLNKLDKAQELIESLIDEATIMERDDLVGEAMMLRAKRHLRSAKKVSEFDAGLAAIRETVGYFAKTGNDAKVGSLQTVLRRAEGVRLARFA